MARTNEDAVALIIQVDRTIITDFDPFMASADIIVDNVVAVAPIPSDARLELVARYLAAHFIAIAQGQIQMEKVKSIQQQFATYVDKGFAITHWGSTAMMVDTTGRLAAFHTRLMEGGGVKQFFWAGTA